MPFSQSSISDVFVRSSALDLYISWVSSAPKGSIYQVYLDRRLAWYGKSQYCHIPLPRDSSGRNLWVQVGTVGVNEPSRDYSASLHSQGGSGERAQLTWQGGTYLDASGSDDIRGYHLFRSPIAGAPVD